MKSQQLLFTRMVGQQEEAADSCDPEIREVSGKR